MKQKTTILALTLLLALWLGSTVGVQAKTKSGAGSVYVFGMSASFSDSTVYFTDIQQLSPVQFTKKYKFLINRDGYSSQLKGYLQGLGEAHPTCITFYNTDRKKLEKKRQKVMKRYLPQPQKKRKGKQRDKTEVKPFYDVRQLTAEQFSYQVISMDAGTVYVDPDEGERAARKSAQAQKEKRGKGPKKGKR